MVVNKTLLAGLVLSLNVPIYAMELSFNGFFDLNGMKLSEWINDVNSDPSENVRAVVRCYVQAMFNDVESKLDQVRQGHVSVEDVFEDKPFRDEELDQVYVDILSLMFYEEKSRASGLQIDLVSNLNLALNPYFRDGRYKKYNLWSVFRDCMGHMLKEIRLDLE